MYLAKSEILHHLGSRSWGGELFDRPHQVEAEAWTCWSWLYNVIFHWSSWTVFLNLLLVDDCGELCYPTCVYIYTVYLYIYIYILACLSTMFLGYLFRHCFTIFVPNFSEFWNFCPQLLAIFVPNFWWFGNFCPQLLGIFVPNFWEFLPPTFGELGIFVPNFWGFLPPTFRDLGIFVPKSWGQKFPNSWGQ